MLRWRAWGRFRGDFVAPPPGWSRPHRSVRSARLDPGRRNFHAVWPSLFATSMGLMAFLPVLALYVQERFGIDDPAELAFWTSVVYGVAPLCAACFGPLWGGLGDRVGKKPMAIRANLAIAATTALMPLAPTPTVLLVMRAVQGVLAGYVAPAMALAAAGAPRDQHGVLIARLQVAMAAGSFLGPFVGAVATHLGGRASLFWLTSVLSAAGALWLHWRAREAATAREASPFLREFMRASAELLANRVFAWLLLLVLLLRLGQNMLEPFVALFVRELGPPAWLAASCATPDLAIDLSVGALGAPGRSVRPVALPGGARPPVVAAAGRHGGGGDRGPVPAAALVGGLRDGGLDGPGLRRGEQASGGPAPHPGVLDGAELHAARLRSGADAGRRLRRRRRRPGELPSPVRGRRRAVLRRRDRHAAVAAVVDPPRRGAVN